jgi:hypothetical protein
LSSAASPGVQPVEEIIRDLDTRVAMLNQVAATIYDVWLKGIKP